jgi:hypothetical protein
MLLKRERVEGDPIFSLQAANHMAYHMQNILKTTGNGRWGYQPRIIL